jgi:hypothetical protein
MLKSWMQDLISQCCSLLKKREKLKICLNFARRLKCGNDRANEMHPYEWTRRGYSMKYRKTERRSMKYLLELKQKVLKDYFEGNDGIRGLERTYGVPHQLILSWIKTCQQP